MEKTANKIVSGHRVAENVMADNTWNARQLVSQRVYITPTSNFSSNQLVDNFGKNFEMGSDPQESAPTLLLLFGYQKL